MIRLSLTHKVLIFIVITLAVIVTLRVGSARLIILKEFVKLEEDLTSRDMDRLVSAINRECAAMTQILGDWCAWNATLDYLQGRNPDYVAENLTTDTFTNLGLHLVVLADAALADAALADTALADAALADGSQSGSAHGFQWARAYHPEDDALVPLSQQMTRYLAQTEALWKHPSAKSRRAGLLQTPMGLMLVASGPIVNSENQGPVGGTLIMARHFGPSAVAALKAQMKLEIEITPLTDASQGAPSYAHTHTHLKHGPVTVTPVDEKTIQARAVIADMLGQSSIAISVKAARDVVAQGHRTIHYFLFWQTISGVLVTLMTIVFVRHVILKPITTLNRQVTAIAKNSSFADRLHIASSDEIGAMSRAVNQMLAALETANAKQLTAYEGLKQAQAQLVQSAKLASIGELAAGVAHELNQPLMVIRGTAQMLERGRVNGRLDVESIGEQLNLIERNTKRMMSVIEHLRTFARQSTRERTRVDVNKTIESCFLLLGEQLRVQDVGVETDLADDLPRVWCDEHQLEQVFLNLITNARDAIKEKASAGEWNNGGQMHLSTRHLSGPPERVEICVRDNGGGIAEDKLDWVFDPFFTTKDVGKGTGLGLSISYGIIKEYQGDLRVEDTGPEGTTFVVELPAGASGDAPENEERQLTIDNQGLKTNN